MERTSADLKVLVLEALSRVLSWIGRATFIVALLWSSLHAQRIVDVQLATLGPANLCGDRQIVVTIGLSTPLYVSDSLLLFEFVVGYNPAKLQFIAPLFIGTVADNADYTGSGAIDSATVRVYAFNVTRPFRGSGVLCGLLFRYRGDCPDTTGIRLVYEPEKNVEAKISYGELGAAIVSAIEQSNSSLTAQFPQDSLSVTLGSRIELPLTITIPSERVRRCSFHLTASEGIVIEKVTLAEYDSLTLYVESSDSSSLQAWIESPSVLRSRDVTIKCAITLNRSGRAQLIVNPGHPQCACVSAVAGDSVTILVSKDLRVSEVESHALVWSRDGDMWKLWNFPDQACELDWWDSLGRHVAKMSIESEPVILRADNWNPMLIRLRNGCVIRAILR
jgi:hypothetical protein